MIFTDKAAKEKISSLESRVSELEADIVTKDEAIESHAAEITAKDQTIAEHVASIASRDESITALTTEKESLTASITAKDGEIQTLKAEVETAKASAGKLATEQLAAIGQPEALEIEEQSIIESKTLTRTQFNALSPAEKSKFSIAGGKIKG